MSALARVSWLYFKMIVLPFALVSVGLSDKPPSDLGLIYAAFEKSYKWSTMTWDIGFINTAYFDDALSVWIWPIAFVSWLVPHWFCQLVLSICNIFGPHFWNVAAVVLCWLLPSPGRLAKRFQAES